METTPQTVASGQTPISIDWDYNNFATRRSSRRRTGTSIPSDGQYGAHYCQAVNATAPHPFAARLWQEFLYCDQGQILYLKGYSHPARSPTWSRARSMPRA